MFILHFRCVLRSTVENTLTYYSATRGSVLIQGFCKKAREGKEIDVIRREITAEALEDDPVEFPHQKKKAGVRCVELIKGQSSLLQVI